MLVNQAATREWKATDYPGIERSLFRHNDTHDQFAGPARSNAG